MSAKVGSAIAGTLTDGSVRVVRRASPVDAMLLGTVLLWSLNITVSKYLFEHGWKPLAYGTIRYFLAICLFWAFTYYRERSFRIARNDVWLVLFAALMIFVNQICFVYGIKLVHASTVALLPVANGGVGSSLNGTLIAIATAATWACYTVTIVPLMRRYSPFRISALVLAIGWVPLALVSIPQVGAQHFTFGWKVWLGFGYAVVGPLFLTNILWFTAISRVGSSRASLFANLQPFFAVVFALLLLNESLSGLEIAGGVLIFAGIAWERYRRRPPLADAVPGRGNATE